LISDDLKHPRINIFHTPERKQDAQAFCSKYTNLGAKVTLLEVDDDLSIRKHLGKLYYFDDSPRFKEIANSLAKDLRDIEQVSPHYLQLSQNQQPNYAIWIVKTNKFQTNQTIAPTPKPNQVKNVKSETTELEISSQPPIEMLEICLIQCPKCHSSVRNDRLAKHIAKVHDKQNQTPPKSSVKAKVVNDAKSEVSRKHTSHKSARREPITLISKRGTRINKLMSCDSCLSTEIVLWHYAESSRGEINICGRCKSGLFNRSFDRKDALDLAFQGGAFESNRRRH